MADVPLDIDRLVEKARQIRIDLIWTVIHAGAGHLGGSLSAVEIVVALYFRIMKIDPTRPEWQERDRFVLSKGHATPLYYCTLAHRGYFPMSWLKTYDQINSRLQGHPDMTKTPGVDMTTGSLGQGLSAAIGMRLAGERCGLNFRTFVLLGDGELQEGQIWEAMTYAGHKRIRHLIAIVDSNTLQLSTETDKCLPVVPSVKRWADFGWEVGEIDGHNMEQVVDALERAYNWSDGPICIIAHTKKGKGISFMENAVAWHSKPPSPEEGHRALIELGANPDEEPPWLK